MAVASLGTVRRQGLGAGTRGAGAAETERCTAADARALSRAAPRRASRRRHPIVAALSQIAPAHRGIPGITMMPEVCHPCVCLVRSTKRVPLLYVAIGAIAFLLAYLDPVSRACNDRVRHRHARADRGAHGVLAASGLPCSEPRVFGRGHRSGHRSLERPATSLQALSVCRSLPCRSVRRCRAGEARVRRCT